MSTDEDVIGYLGSLGAQQLRAVVDEEGGVSLLDGDGELLLDDSIGSAEAAAVALRGVAGGAARASCRVGAAGAGAAALDLTLDARKRPARP